MAGTRISQLPLATNVVGADVFPFSSISGSETRRVTAQVLGVALSLIGTGVSATAPLNPINGQMWMDTSTNPPVLKVYNGATWTVVSFLPGSSIATSPAGTAPTGPALGQLWQDTSQNPDQLKMYDGANWVRVDPQGITQTAADARYLQPATAASTYLPTTGGTMSGNLNLVGAPTSTNMAATKGYVDGRQEFASGTSMLFAQTAAPTGWIKSTTHNNKALRVVSGTAGSGGTAAFTSVFGLRGVPLLEHSHSVSDPGHSHTIRSDNNNQNGTNGVLGGDGSGFSGFFGGRIGAAGTGIGINNAGTPSATMDFDVQYVDVIIATKS